MTTYRAPHLDPTAWDSVTFTGTNKQSVLLPPRPICGNAKVSLASEIKIDSKAAAGKSGATVTKQGARDADVEIELEYAARYYEEVQAALDAIDPRGPSKGGPFLLACPNMPGGFEAIQIKKISPRGTAAISRGVGRVKISGKECSFPKSGGTGSGIAKKKKLTDFERATLQFNIDLLEQRIKTDAQLGASRTGTELQEVSDRIASLRNQINGLQSQLDNDKLAPTPTSETTTPGAPGNAIGRGFSDIQKAINDPASFRPGANGAAPSGAP
jgi:hypothetical protein